MYLTVSFTKNEMDELYIKKQYKKNYLHVLILFIYFMDYKGKLESALTDKACNGLLTDVSTY